MTRDAPDQGERPGGFRSAAWTGGLPKAVSPPPPDPERAATRLELILLFCGLLALWVGWWLLLTMHSPLLPDPGSGHTEPLRLDPRRGATLYVKPWEAAVSTGLAFAAFIVPAACVAWRAIRRRLRR